MVYLSTFVIAFLLYALNSSFLPHFWFNFNHIILILPFITLYSLRDKTIFPYILAVAIGILYNTIILSSFSYFAVIFLLVTIVGKNIFSKIASYGMSRAAFILTIFGYLLYLASDWKLILNSYNQPKLYISLLFNAFILFLVQIIFTKIFAKYFDWVEKTTTERYR